MWGRWLVDVSATASTSTLPAQRARTRRFCTQVEDTCVVRNQPVWVHQSPAASKLAVGHGSAEPPKPRTSVLPRTTPVRPFRAPVAILLRHVSTLGHGCRSTSHSQAGIARYSGQTASRRRRAPLLGPVRSDTTRRGPLPLTFVVG